MTTRTEEEIRQALLTEASEWEGDNKKVAIMALSCIAGMLDIGITTQELWEASELTAKREAQQ